MKAYVFILFSLFCTHTLSATDLMPVETKTIEIYRTALPSTVNIQNIRLVRNMFYGEVEVPQGAGSGWVYDTLGHIVTNYHVVQG